MNAGLIPQQTLMSWSAPVLLGPVFQLLLPQSHLPLTRLQIQPHVGAGRHRLTCLKPRRYTDTVKRGGLKTQRGTQLPLSSGQY